VISRQKLKNTSIVFLATGGFVGFIPIAPGTFGTLVGVALVWLCRDFSAWALTLLALVLGAAGVWICDEANRIFKKADAPRIVIDEIVGILVTMIGIPITGYWLVCGFVIFRFLDIVKLPPARFFDTQMKNGWGVMLDDLSAAIYGNIWLHLMLRAAL